MKYNYACNNNYNSIDLESCDNGQVRLTDGYSYREGRVEVCSGGVWGSVYNCDQEGIAGTACYQTGFPREGKFNLSEDTQPLASRLNQTQVPWLLVMEKRVEAIAVVISQ